MFTVKRSRTSTGSGYTISIGDGKPKDVENLAEVHLCLDHYENQHAMDKGCPYCKEIGIVSLRHADRT